MLINDLGIKKCKNEETWIGNSIINNSKFQTIC